MLDPAVVKRYSDALPESYKEDFAPARALADIGRLEQLTDGGIDQYLYRRPEAEPGSWRFSLYIAGSGVSLSQVLPVLQSLGVEVVDERPYQLECEGGTERWIYDFGLQARPELVRNALGGDLDAALLEAPSQVDALRTRFTDAFEAVWYDRAEADGLNELVLRAGLPWRSVAILRAYARRIATDRHGRPARSTAFVETVGFGPVVPGFEGIGEPGAQGILTRRFEQCTTEVDALRTRFTDAFEAVSYDDRAEGTTT